MTFLLIVLSICVSKYTLKRLNEFMKALKQLKLRCPQTTSAGNPVKVSEFNKDITLTDERVPECPAQPQHRHQEGITDTLLFQLALFT